MQSNNNVIMAAAGSGKTWGICNEVISKVKKTRKKILIVTYTNKGIESIFNEYQKQNYGVIDSKVAIKTWFQFLLSDLIKPYQSSILGTFNTINSIDFSSVYGKINYNKRGTPKHYISSNRDILSNTASEFAIDSNNKTKGKVIARLEEVYSYIYIDEVQDLAGEDLSLLEMLFASKINIICVGDYKQSTFTTHNTKKNKKISGTNIIDYFVNLDKKNIIKLIYNKNSRRFNTEICKFSNEIFGDAITNIETIMIEKKENDGVYLICSSDLPLYHDTYKPIVLKYDINTKIDKYDSFNFGQCKGMTFHRVVIFPNGPYTNFLKKGVPLSSPSKYYVAATRAKYSIAFVVDKIFENRKFRFENINISGKEIRVSKYIVT